MMVRIALRGIRAHLPRLVMSVLAVALGVSFVAGTFSLRTLLSGVFDDIVAVTTTADVYVRGVPETDGGTMSRVPLALADDIAALPGVETVVPEFSGMVVLVGADGTAVLSTQAPSLGFGLDPSDPAVSVVAGRAPQRAGEVALESATLASSGLALGEATTMVLGGQIVPVTVVGEVDGGAPMAGATLTYLDQDTAHALFAPDDLVPYLAVHADGTADGLLEAVTALVAGQEADGGFAGAVDVLTGPELRAEALADIESQLGFVGTFLMIFALVALFVGGFIIANTFAMLTRLQQRELALLRAVGAAPGQVFATVVGQAVVIGAVGSLAGVAGGQGLVALLRTGMARLGMDLGRTVPLTTGTVAACLAIGTAVTVLAAALPARRAALVAPIEAMRDGEAEPERSLRTRSAIGVLLAVVGVGAVALASFGTGTTLALDLTDAAPGLLGVGAVALLAGLLVGAPGLARSVMPALAAPLRGLGSLTSLARGNVTRNPRRTASTAGALMIGMTLVAAAAVLAASTRASVADVVAQEFTGDLMVHSATYAVPRDAVTAIADAPGVAAALPLAWAMVSGQGPADDAPVSTILASADAAVFDEALTVTVEAGSPTALAAGDLVLRADAAETHGWALGDEITLSREGRTVVGTVGAVIDTVALGADLVIVPERFAEVVPDAAATIDSVFVQGEAGTSPTELRAGVAAAVSPFVVLSVLDAEEFAGLFTSLVDQVLVVLYAMLGLSVLIAGLGIVNTLALSVIERTREIGLLRAVGLGRLQLAGTVAIESVLTAVFGTAVGLGLGTALAAATTRVLADQGLTTLAVPWAALGTMLGLAVVLGVVAAGGPAVRAVRLPVLDAVSYE